MNDYLVIPDPDNDIDSGFASASEYKSAEESSKEKGYDSEGRSSDMASVVEAVTQNVIDLTGGGGGGGGGGGCKSGVSSRLNIGRIVAPVKKRRNSDDLELPSQKRSKTVLDLRGDDDDFVVVEYQRTSEEGGEEEEGDDVIVSEIKCEDDAPITTLNDQTPSTSEAPVINSLDSTKGRTTDLYSAGVKSIGRLSMDRVQLDTSGFPASTYEGFKPPLPISKEREVLRTFTDRERNRVRLEEQVSEGHHTRSTFANIDEDDFVSFILEDFTIYRANHGKRLSGEMVSLCEFYVKSGSSDLLFDGIITDGHSRHFIQGVSLKTLSIGNYCDPTSHDTSKSIWIQTDCSKGFCDGWYELGRPSFEYTRYHRPFVWLSTFAKHVLDFFDAHQDEDITLNHFKSRFIEWLLPLHEESPEFKIWLDDLGTRDFRHSVSVYSKFLYQQTAQTEHKFLKASVFAEVDSLTAIKPPKGSPGDRTTVVTPFVFECFKGIFGPYMKAVSAPETRKEEAETQEVRNDTPELLEIQLRLQEQQQQQNEQLQSKLKIEETAVAVNANHQEITCVHKVFEETKTQGQVKKKYEEEEAVAVVEHAVDRLTTLKEPSPTVPPPNQQDIDVLITYGKPPPENVKVGDVIAIERDQETKWKGKRNLWYCYVQGIKHRRHTQFYEVIWLYTPEDTLCSGMHYPYANELFFSDHCNHGDDLIPHEEVVSKVAVKFFARPEEVRYTEYKYFVRTKYCSVDNSFVTMKKIDIAICSCHDTEPNGYEEAVQTYKVGDTILVESVCNGVDILEPVAITGFKRDIQQLTVRELPRLGRDFCNARERKPRNNELVWTENFIDIKPKYISRKCHIRFVTEDDVIVGRLPKLYDDNGSYNLFFISCRELPTGNLVPFTSGDELPSINFGVDVERPVETRLRGLDLFCGGGNFGRGLEDGGAVNNLCAVDMFSAALHTYRANLKNTESTHLYLGSVNKYLKDAIKGNFADGVLNPDDVDFISAGSPCQGFSTANNSKDNESGLQNCSLVASVASFVDVYRPKYALLENVHGLATSRSKQDANGKKTGEVYNVFSQLLCSLVGMGYQVQQFTMDAWSHGSGQSRTRMFVSIAAPGQTPLRRPACSHAHPTGKKDRGITKAPNGLIIGPRDFSTCPFPNRTAKDIMDDLPRLGDAHPGICIKYPDHRVSRANDYKQRKLMSYLPKNPGASYFRACRSGWMPPGLRGIYKETKSRSLEGCRTWSRIPANGLCRTITTTITPQCAFTGTWVHYDEPRLLSVMECRRAQSYPDDEVLVGTCSDTFKIVGNSVDRKVSRALGLSLREAVQNLS